MAGRAVMLGLRPPVPAATLDNAADNECAEALLQLAMSIAPSASSAGTPPATFSVTFSSPLKTNLTHSPNYGSSAGCGSSPGYSSGFSDDTAERNSVLKYILQDHCYAGSSDEKCRNTDYPPAFRSIITDESLMEDILGDDVGVPPRWNKENALETQHKPTRKKSPSKRARPYFGSCPRKNYTASAAQANKHASVKAAETSIMASKEKYNNFQLLLKCLVANDPMGTNEKVPLEESENMPKDVSQLKDEEAAVQSKAEMEYDDDLENEADNSDVEGDSNYVCPDCPKTFSKRRYLTKHVRRMHPETKIPEMKDGVATACPNCFCVIQRRNFHRHLDVCDVEMSRMKNQDPESNVVFCQFCGAQMKRQLLGKHLAKEHCIDRHTVQYEQEFSKFLADEENNSLYPSDTSNPMQENNGKSGAVEVEKPKVDVLALIVPCPKCNISISDDLLGRHMALDHDIIVDNASALAASRCSCKHSMLQAYLDGTTETKGSGTGSNYPCEACVQSLSTLSEHCSATVSAHSSERIALSSPISGMSSTSPVKSTPGSGSTVSAEETRMQVSLLEDTAHTLLKCAAAPVAKV